MFARADRIAALLALVALIGSHGPAAMAWARVPELAGAPAPVRVEYIAHSCFLIQSPGGTRIAIDPFNGNIWLGYSFPEAVEADAVLVSHPHYDHDATYYFPQDTTVLRRPGEYRIGDVTVRGIATEHVGAYRFRQRGETPYNTVWVLETGGLRIAHMGDSRPLNEVDLAAIGPLDVVFVPATFFADESGGMLSLLREIAHPKVLIPMHYRHADITELPDGMLAAEEYLAGETPTWVESNTVELDAAALPVGEQLLVLQHSPALQRWSDALYEAWGEADDGAGLLADAEQARERAAAEESLWEGLSHYEAAMDLVPTVLKFGYGAGRALAMLDHTADAIETLDHALARAPDADWTDRARVHMLLGELYEASGQTAIAIAHYEYVAAQQLTHETAMRERALARLEALR